MKVRSVTTNNRASQLELTTYSGKSYAFPYAELRPSPNTDDPIREAYVDKELAREAVTYVLESGKEQSLLLDQVLHFNEEPNYMLKVLMHQLSVEAQRRLKTTKLSRRTLARLLRTSPAQIYRLADPAYTKKNLNKLVNLLQVLGAKVDVKVSDDSKKYAS